MLAEEFQDGFKMIQKSMEDRVKLIALKVAVSEMMNGLYPRTDWSGSPRWGSEDTKSSLIKTVWLALENTGETSGTNGN